MVVWLILGADGEAHAAGWALWIMMYMVRSQGEADCAHVLLDAGRSQMSLVVLRLKGGGHKGPTRKENTWRRKARASFLSRKVCRVSGLDCFGGFA